jgi:5-methylcytosine-specific restriction endonuclease McrA
MDYFFYNTDARAIIERPRPRFRVLMDNGFAAVGGDRQRFGKQLEQLGQADILLMYENRIGITAVGKVKERWDGVSHQKLMYYTPAEIEDLSGGAFEYRIAVDWFLDLSDSPISVEEIRERIGYTPRGAVRRIVKQRGEVVRIIEEWCTTQSQFPQEIDEPRLYMEGASNQISVNAFERNPEARRQCIQHFGADCCICGFNFGSVYGSEVEGYIHVHHLVPLSEIRGEYIVDPVKDLRPVCPNCHAVLHLGGRNRKIEEVRQMVKRNRA